MVSRAFRDGVDYWFENNLLRQTEIEFHWANWEYLNEEELTEKCFFRLTLELGGFRDGEKTIAYFEEKKKKEEEPEDEEIYYELEEGVIGGREDEEPCELRIVLLTDHHADEHVWRRPKY